MPTDQLEQKLHDLESENKKLKSRICDLHIQYASASCHQLMDSIDQQIQIQQQAEEEIKTLAWATAGISIGCLAIGVGIGALIFGNNE